MSREPGTTAGGSKGVRDFLQQDPRDSDNDKARTYHVEGDINKAYSEILINRICDHH